MQKSKTLRIDSKLLNTQGIGRPGQQVYQDGALELMPLGKMNDPVRSASFSDGPGRSVDQAGAQPCCTNTDFTDFDFRL